MKTKISKKNNKKKKISKNNIFSIKKLLTKKYLNWLFLIITTLSILLSIIHIINLSLGKNNFYQFKFYHFFSFSKYNIFLILFIIINTIYKKNKTIINILSFSVIVNILINTLFLRSFVRDWNLYSNENNILFFNLIIYYLEYIVIPVCFLFFYFNNKFKISKKHLICPLFISILYIAFSFFLFKLFEHENEKNFWKEQFINPYDKKNLLFSYIKIIFSFLTLSFSIFFFKRTEKYFLIRLLLIFLTLIIISILPYNEREWAHAKKVILNTKTMGTGLFPETQEISEYFQNISDLKPQELIKNKDKILELGSGCGNITQYLINKFGLENIICIEINKDLCDELKQRFPGIKVIQGNAADFEELISKENIKNKQIKGIVSTLPIGIFEKTDFQKIKNSIEKIVEENNIKYMNYRFKFFEKEEREMNKIKKNNNFVFISEMIMPVSVYTYVKKEDKKN
ncbi:rRNA adenine N-6-methyltransferase family protein [Candidatus Phytoplasma palmae]|uniref:rRNA adenine N-6-methyltransferase family protein n=1 Tax=Candidatus Phytoplasma palmae TaxID=85624 RepID=UPI0039904991